MNDNKWPSPPWIAVSDDAYGDGIMYVTTAGRCRAGKVGIASVDVNFDGAIGQENEAAVTLIAAAPELYEALEALRSEVSRELWSAVDGDQVMAKARGEV